MIVDKSGVCVGELVEGHIHDITTVLHSEGIIGDRFLILARSLARLEIDDWLSHVAFEVYDSKTVQMSIITGALLLPVQHWP